MKTDIILSGVGGQGIVSIAAVIGYTAIEAGLNLKQSEVHGMSQRGGEVQSHLRLSDKEIFSDLIPKGKADLIISVEPMEGLRYLPYLSANGWLITNTNPFVNIPNYPDIAQLMDEINSLPRVIALDVDKIAKEIGAIRSANMVILGAASPFINLSFEHLKNGIKSVFKGKGEGVIKQNIDSLEKGREFVNKYVEKLLNRH